MASLGLLKALDGVGVEQDVERLVQLVVRDLAAVDVEPAEERLAQDALDGLVVRFASVHGMRVIEEIKRRQEDGLASL